MRSELVVTCEVSLQASLGIAHRVIGMQIDFLVFHAPPEPFHKHVVTPSAFAIHADLDTIVFQQAGEFLAGELAALVGVEDFRSTVAVDRFLYRFNAEVGG